MILLCNFEEVTALNHGAHAYLSEASVPGSGVSTSSEVRRSVELLLVWLAGDFTVSTLAEQRELQGALHAVVEHLRVELDARVVATHAADEEAVAAYFDFAHALSVFDRMKVVGEEMLALVEVMTGVSPNEAVIRDFVFPD